MSEFINEPFKVVSPHVRYLEDCIESRYTYHSTTIQSSEHIHHVVPNESTLLFRTETKVKKTGVMLVGWGGNNGTTFTAGILANKHKLQWFTKEGKHSADFLGSLTQVSTVRLGLDSEGRSVYIPFHRMLPMLNPEEDLVISGETVHLFLFLSSPYPSFLQDGTYLG